MTWEYIHFREIPDTATGLLQKLTNGGWEIVHINSLVTQSGAVVIVAILRRQVQ